MTAASAEWENRMATLWARSDDHDDEFVALTALSRYLPRYNRSAARYAQVLTE